MAKRIIMAIISLILFGCLNSQAGYDVISFDKNSGHMIIQLDEHLGSGTDLACFEATQVFYDILEDPSVTSLEIRSITGFVPSKYTQNGLLVLRKHPDGQIHEYSNNANLVSLPTGPNDFLEYDATTNDGDECYDDPECGDAYYERWESYLYDERERER